MTEKHKSTVYKFNVIAMKPSSHQRAVRQMFVTSAGSNLKKVLYRNAANYAWWSTVGVLIKLGTANTNHPSARKNSNAAIQFNSNPFYLLQIIRGIRKWHSGKQLISTSIYLHWQTTVFSFHSSVNHLCVIHHCDWFKDVTLTLSLAEN